MKKQDQVCTLEQATRLKELGVEQESLLYHTEKFGVLPMSSIDFTGDPISAFTVGELGVMLPSISSEFSNKVECWKNRKGGYVWAVYEDGFIKSGFAVQEEPTEAQARAAMLIFLLESNHITPTEVNNRLKNS